jgi:hypothetical protein
MFLVSFCLAKGVSVSGFFTWTPFFVSRRNKADHLSNKVGEYNKLYWY